MLNGIWRFNRKGQGTVEYLLMLTVIVGVVLVSGFALKRYMPGLFTMIETQITDAARGMGSNN